MLIWKVKVQLRRERRHKETCWAEFTVTAKTIDEACRKSLSMAKRGFKRTAFAVKSAECSGCLDG